MKIAIVGSRDVAVTNSRDKGRLRCKREGKTLPYGLVRRPTNWGLSVCSHQPRVVGTGLWTVRDKGLLQYKRAVEDACPYGFVRCLQIGVYRWLDGERRPPLEGRLPPKAGGEV